MEKLGLLSLVMFAVWLRSGLRFQVKSAGRFRSGLHSTSFFPNFDIFHAFNFRHAFTATYQLFYNVYIHRLPSSRLWYRLRILEALAASFFLCSDGVVLLNGLMLARKVPIKNDSEDNCTPLGNWSLRPRGKDG